MTCRWTITNYNGNYSVQSGLHKSTHPCGKVILRGGYCKRHWIINATKTLQRAAYQKAHWMSKGQNAAADDVQKNMDSLIAKIAEVEGR